MKKFTAFALSALLAAFMAAPAFAYDDVLNETKGAAAIAEVSELGIMTGYDDGTFKPDGAITRAEFAKVAVLAAQNKLGDVPTTLQYVVFDDVKEDGWYVENIEKAVNMGLMKGDAEGTFRPNDTVSEAEVYTVMLRMLGYNLDNDSKKWPDNYLELAASQGAPVDPKNVAAECTRANVAEIVAWALETATADDEESNSVALDTYAVVTAVTDTRLTVFTMEGETKSLRDIGSMGSKLEVGQLVKVEANKAGALMSVSTANVKTNDEYEAEIAKEKIELNGKSYGLTKDAVVLAINSAGGVNVVSADKLLESSYAAGLRSSKYTAPIQYVLQGNAVSCLLISDYAGQSELRFGFAESVGKNADGIVVKFWGDENDYQWDAAKNDGEVPKEDTLYAYVLRSDGVRGYAVARTEEVSGVITSASQDIYRVGDKKFVLADDTVILKVKYEADGKTIISCEYADEILEGDDVVVRYAVDSSSDDGVSREAAYVILKDK